MNKKKQKEKREGTHSLNLLGKLSDLCLVHHTAVLASLTLPDGEGPLEKRTPRATGVCPGLPAAAVRSVDYTTQILRFPRLRGALSVLRASSAKDDDGNQLPLLQLSVKARASGIWPHLAFEATRCVTQFNTT